MPHQSCNLGVSGCLLQALDVHALFVEQRGKSPSEQMGAELEVSLYNPGFSRRLAPLASEVGDVLTLYLVKVFPIELTELRGPQAARYKNQDNSVVL